MSHKIASKVYGRIGIPVRPGKAGAGDAALTRDVASPVLGMQNRQRSHGQREDFAIDYGPSSGPRHVPQS